MKPLAAITFAVALGATACAGSEISFTESDSGVRVDEDSGDPGNASDSDASTNPPADLGPTDSGDATDLGPTDSGGDAAIDASADAADTAIDMSPDTAIDTGPSCSSDETDCSGVCIDTDLDIDHCGACGQPCIAPFEASVDACTAGECVYSCNVGHYDLDGDLHVPGSNGCESDCFPTSEICDGLDNDCDETVDNICPIGVSLVNNRDGLSFGGSGGSFFRTGCPQGTVLIGIQGREATRVDRVQGLCKSLSLVEETSSIPYSYSAESTGSATFLAAQGGTGGSITAAICPAGEMVIGIFGREGSELDNLSVRCGRIDIPQVNGNFVIQRTTTVTRAFGGGSGGSAFSYTCPGDTVVTGLFGRDGSRIDAIGVTCSDVTASLR